MIFFLRTCKYVLLFGEAETWRRRGFATQRSLHAALRGEEECED